MGKIESKRVKVVDIGILINNIINLIIIIPCIILLTMLMFKLNIAIHTVYYVIIIIANCYLFINYINAMIKVRDYFKYYGETINIYYGSLDEINNNFIKSSFKIIESIDNTVIFIDKDNYDLVIKYKEFNGKYTLYDYDFSKPHYTSTLSDPSYINDCIIYTIQACHYFNPFYDNEEFVTLEELSNLKHTLMVLSYPYDDENINYIHAIYWMVDYMKNNKIPYISTIKDNEKERD